jgi:hypothetical protein
MVPVVAGPETENEPVEARPSRQSFRIADTTGGMAADTVEGRGIRLGEAIAEARQAIGPNPEGARQCRSARPCGHAAGPGPEQPPEWARRRVRGVRQELERPGLEGPTMVRERVPGRSERMASGDQTDARNDILGCFGRSRPTRARRPFDASVDQTEAGKPSLEMHKECRAGEDPLWVVHRSEHLGTRRRKRVRATEESPSVKRRL